MDPQPAFSARITYDGDPIVGLPDLIFIAQIPDFREVYRPDEKMQRSDLRAITRSMVANFYQLMNDESRPVVVFSDELDEEPNEAIEAADFEGSIDSLPCYGEKI